MPFADRAPIDRRPEPFYPNNLRRSVIAGKGITWAVMDSGIDGTHPHFRLHKTVDLASTYHKDFTSLATPGSALRDECGHVSGAIAAFLSIRKEFIGEPERVKKIFTSTATDLGHDRYFQGSGLVDLMRAIQSV